MVLSLQGLCSPVQEVEGVQPHHRRAGRPAGSAQGAAGPAAAVAGYGSQDPEQRQRRAQLTRSQLGKSGWSVHKWSTGERSCYVDIEQLGT